MCIVCILYEKDKLTKSETLKALWEQVIDVKDPELKHLYELIREGWKKDEGNYK